METLPNVDRLEIAHHVHVCQTTLVNHQIVDQSVSLIQIVHLINHVLLNVAAIHVKDHVVLIQVEFSRPDKINLRTKISKISKFLQSRQKSFDVM